MREFLLELYLQHGEREFVPFTRDNLFFEARWSMEFIDHVGWVENPANKTKSKNKIPKYKLSPKAIEYIKNLDNP